MSTHILESVVMLFLIGLFVTVLVSLYFLPTLIGIVRGSEHMVLVVLTNIFLGWTGIGWLGSLLIAILL